MSQEGVQTEEYQFSKKKIIWGIVAIFAVYGTMAYSVQTMNIARPKIAADLDGLSLYGWSLSVPSLIMALVTIIFGKFSDMYGRRIMLMIALVAALIGTVMSALSPDFIFLIIASAVAAVGAGAMMPLVFAVVGDLFPPSERGKWVGLLNIPLGFFTLVGPPLGGFVVDNLNWRYLYWMAIPLLIVCLLTVPIGVPSIANRDSSRKIDIRGCIFVAIAASTAILGFSWAGSDYPWLSPPILSLLGFSLVLWIVFLFLEGKTKEPVLDPTVLRNPTFSRVALATFFSSFASVGMMMYFPMFLQGVQDISTYLSGYITIPFGVLTAFMGIPAGFLISRTGRFKWMYIVGYGLLTLSIFALIPFNAGTPIIGSVAVALLAGLGYGVIPTINTVVVQNAVPKRLMGAAMGAIFFFLMIGTAISPAILGSAMNASYAKALSQSLPEEINEIADSKTMAALDDPKVLLSAREMERLENAISEKGQGSRQLFEQTVAAIRHSLEAGLNSIFWIGAIMMVIAFLIISTIPRKSGEPAE